MSAVAATDDLASTERALHLLELEIGRKLDGFIQGEHPSAWPGPGSDAGEARAYEPGDDVRRIDWSLTARSGEVAVREGLGEPYVAKLLRMLRQAGLIESSRGKLGGYRLARAAEELQLRHRETGYVYQGSTQCREAVTVGIDVCRWNETGIGQHSSHGIRKCAGIVLSPKASIAHGHEPGDQGGGNQQDDEFQ